MTRSISLRILVSLLVSFLTAAAIVVFGALALAQAPNASEEWSVRLLQEKARIERFQKRLDHLNAKYAKAVVAGETATRLRTLKGARQAAADALAAAERKLPALVAEARADGVGEEILHPYRYTASPASAP